MIQNSPLPDSIPVDALHGNAAANDPFVSLDHPGDISRAELLVCIDEHQVRRIGIQKVPGNRVPGPLDQGFVAKEYASRLMAGLLQTSPQLEQGLGIFAVTHTPVHGGSDK